VRSYYNDINFLLRKLFTSIGLPIPILKDKPYDIITYTIDSWATM
jgi:hypothetical protein